MINFINKINLLNLSFRNGYKVRIIKNIIPIKL